MTGLAWVEDVRSWRRDVPSRCARNGSESGRSGRLFGGHAVSRGHRTAEGLKTLLSGSGWERLDHGNVETPRLAGLRKVLRTSTGDVSTDDTPAVKSGASRVPAEPVVVPGTRGDIRGGCVERGHPIRELSHKFRQICHRARELSDRAPCAATHLAIA